MLLSNVRPLDTCKCPGGSAETVWARAAPPGASVRPKPHLARVILCSHLDTKQPPAASGVRLWRPRPALLLLLLPLVGLAPLLLLAAPAAAAAAAPPAAARAAPAAAAGRPVAAASAAPATVAARGATVNISLALVGLPPVCGCGESYGGVASPGAAADSSSGSARADAGACDGPGSDCAASACMTRPQCIR